MVLLSKKSDAQSTLNTASESRIAADFALFRLNRSMGSSTDLSDASCMSPEPDRRHVGVIGAGVAGMACTMALIGMGVSKITLIEARDRLGGRVCYLASQMFRFISLTDV